MQYQCAITLLYKKFFHRKYIKLDCDLDPKIVIKIDIFDETLLINLK